VLGVGDGLVETALHDAGALGGQTELPDVHRLLEHRHAALGDETVRVVDDHVVEDDVGLLVATDPDEFHRVGHCHARFVHVDEEQAEVIVGPEREHEPK